MYSPALKNRWNISSPYAFNHASVRVREVNLMCLTVRSEVFNFVVFDFKDRLACDSLEAPRLPRPPSMRYHFCLHYLTNRIHMNYVLKSSFESFFLCCKIVSCQIVFIVLVKYIYIFSLTLHLCVCFFYLKFSNEVRDI